MESTNWRFSSIIRTTVNLKVSLGRLKSDHLDFLNPEKDVEGGERKIVEVVDESIRILYNKSPYPAPLLPRTQIFIQIVQDFELEDGKRATLIFGEAATHNSYPEVPSKEVRLKNILYPDFYEELEIGDKPLTRWTSLLGGSAGLPRILRPIEIGEFNKYFESATEIFADK